MSTAPSADRIKCLGDIVRVHAETRGDAAALVCGDVSLTWSQFYQRVQTVAQALAANGVAAQDRVAVIERNSIETLEVVFGAALLNAVVVNVNWRLAPPEMLQILDDAGARVVLTGSELFGAVEAIETDLVDKTTIVALGPHERWQDYESWLAGHQPADPGLVADPADVAFQLYTSGTTGLPKGVMLTTSNLVGAFSRLRARWGFSDRSVNLAVMPMFHIGGLGWATAGLSYGCRTLVLRDAAPAEVLAALSGQGVTHAFVVPAVIQMILQAPGVDQADFSSLEKLMYGASPISAAVLERALSALRCDFVQLYGLTETTGAITQLEAEDHDPEGRPELLRSCGKPYPWIELRVVEPTKGEDVPVGEVGELWTRSLQNMAGYWNNPEATAAVLDADGWFRTGDLGYRDAAGYVYLFDRAKDMIVSGGENIYPVEVENALMRHPAVVDAAVVGVPDDRWGEAVKAVVVAGPGQAPRPEDLIAFCRQHLAGYKCPKSIDFASTLPRNPSGKLLKRQIRAPYWEGRDRHVG